MNRKTIVLLILGVIACLVGFSSPAHAQLEPPNEGNWEIDRNVEVRDKSIVLNGDLIVQSGAQLNLYNVDLKLNCRSEREYKIKVENNAEINIYNSEISSNTNYKYVLEVESEGELNIYNSTIVDYTTYDPFSVEESTMAVILAVILLIVIVIVIIVVLLWQYSSKKRKVMTTTIESLVGKTGLVVKTVKPNTFSGQVKVESQVWSASAEDKIPKGEKVKIISTKGIKIMVERIK